MQTNINIRIDKETKVQAEHLFNRLGLNMTTAVNIFIKQALLNRGLPFDVKDKDYLNPTEYLEKVILDTKNDDKNGNTITIPATNDAIDNFFDNELPNIKV
jgi:addiction module RelB/DinJ family antitoxin